MDEDVRRSRQLISRRRALSLGGTVSLGALIAACTGSSSPEAAPSSGASTGASTAAPLTPSTTAAADVLALLNQANTCTMAKEETQGPYWFDVDQIRSDLREDRPGTPLVLAVRAHDLSSCSNGAAPTPIANSVVEIWHCDAGGEYSGFESASGGGPGGGGSGETSDGSYSSGDSEATTTDDGTYLRGAQVADANGVAQFTTVYPGWYRGRTVHIHLKLHVNRKTVVTTQLYFDEAVNDTVFATSPYDEHTGRDTRNSDDSIYDESGLVTIRKTGTGYLGAINLGANASAA
jgi:protocatechuate 3,4-dioxygenase beta subunit